MIEENRIFLVTENTPYIPSLKVKYFTDKILALEYVEEIKNNLKENGMNEQDDFPENEWFFLDDDEYYGTTILLKEMEKGIEYDLHE